MPQRKHHSQRGASSLPATGRLLSPRYLVLGAALIVVVTSVAYFPAMQGGFIFDDDIYVTDSALIHAPNGLYRIWFTTGQPEYYPLSYTTLWLEWRLWGMNPTGYHVTNLVLHIAAALMLWVILRRVSIPGGFLAALLFAVHPVNIESVAWIFQRRGLLAMLFFLLSILWYLKFDLQSPLSEESSPVEPPSRLDRPGLGRWYWLSLLAFVLAMLSKGSVAILPLVLLWIVWWQRRRITVQDLSRTTPFFLVAIVLAGVNVWFQTHGSGEVFRTASFSERLAGAGAVVWFYLSKALVPIDLVFVYPQWHVQMHELLWWLPLAAALLVTGVLGWQRDSQWGRRLLFAWGFFGVALVPVLGFTDVGFMKFSLVADHYQHLALLGVVALVAAGFSAWRDRTPGPARKAPLMVAAVVVAALGTLTWRQSRVYGDAITLYRTTLEKNPDCWLAHNNLAATLFKAARPQEAIEHCQQALRLKPDYPEASNILGAALLDAGRPQEAIEQCEQSLRLRPNYALAHNNLGNALLNTGRTQEAIEHYQQALRLKPIFPEAQNNLGFALANAGRLPEAIEQYRQALRLKPDSSADIHYNLGTALAKSGHIPEAIEHLQQALRLEPNFSDGYFNLATAYVQMHRSAEALAAAQKALELAHTQGKTVLELRIKSWLKNYRSQQGNPQDPSSEAHAVPSHGSD